MALNATDLERYHEIREDIADMFDIVREFEGQPGAQAARERKAASAQIRELRAERAIIKGADPEATYAKYDIKANEGIHNGPGSVYFA